MLAAWVREARGLYLNEIDPVRADILRLLFPEATISQQDGAQIGQLGADPTVILMNPPFARNALGNEDHLAAPRHLGASVSALRAGGRLVAVMPDSFNHQGKVGEVFTRALRGCTVAAHFQIHNAFKLQGTSITVRLLAVDKVPGRIDLPVLSCASLSDIVAHLAALPPRAIVKTTVPTSQTHEERPQPRPAEQKPLGAFAKARASLPKAIAPASSPSGEGWADVAYTPVEGAIEASQAVDVYAPWRSQRIVIAGACDHPSPLVESAAMASVSLPIPSAVPRLPLGLVDKGILSAAQLETVIHALEAHEHDLPGRYKMPEKGLDLVASADGHVYRQGYFLGDGTGAGKGRQLAGLLMDQWLRGNRRHIWLSENAALQCDAVRDWEALGGIAPDIQPISRFKPDGKIQLEQGILFASYATLRSAGGGRTRLQQILDWCGPDFDGLILFDEAHAMGGVAGGEGRFGATKGSQQGVAGVELQNRLPRARVVYASATGATDINNLAYAVRLGLWGRGPSSRTVVPSPSGFARAALPRWNWSRANSRPWASTRPGRCPMLVSNTIFLHTI
jgi:hypothetical protein